MILFLIVHFGVVGGGCSPAPFAEICTQVVMEPKHTVYQDGTIAVGLFAGENDVLRLGLRWLPPAPLRGKDGQVQQTTNVMGGETQWFLLPDSFGAAVGRRLIEQRVADCGLTRFFNEAGFRAMVSWLIDLEELSDAMCY
jgi:hypothetical protein